MICSERISLTTDAEGAADVRSVGSLSGRIVEICVAATALNNAGKGEWTITRADDAGAVLTLKGDGPWSRSPRQATHDVTGAALLYAAGGAAVNDGIPIDGLVRVKLAKGKASTKGEVIVYYECCCEG